MGLAKRQHVLTAKEFDQTVRALRRAINVISDQEQEIDRLRQERTKFFKPKETR